MSNETHQRATQVARASYGRLLAILAAGSGDIASAEDALADAFHRALETWPVRGIPDKPEAWLMRVAKNRQIDGHRSSAIRNHVALDDYQALNVSSIDQPCDPMEDERLKLMFVCAHPAIAHEIRTPLMLQTVLGFEAHEIARAFVVSPTAMAQRLVRAKHKIRDAGIPFVIPPREELTQRLDVVLEAIYGAFSIDWTCTDTRDQIDDMSLEALYLADLLAAMLADEPEAWGLAALIAFTLARRSARRDENNAFVPLDQQNVELWDKRLLRHGELCLQRASKPANPGRFQLEAAIQSVHCDRAKTGSVDWNIITRLYEGLCSVAPTLGAFVGRAAAVGHAIGPQEGLACLENLDASLQENFQPALATRAWLLARNNNNADAARIYKKAIACTTNAGDRRYLEGQLSLVLKSQTG
ncbi:MAG: RNA polymerase subunit sigma-70 [Hyphomicrobiales bacterium]|nr:MAG: RNA polymerase subunit sigma-70 [Hyphomicrobiales bacterium]